MPAYPQSVQFGASAVVSLKWPDLKPLITAKNLLLQYVKNWDSYMVFAMDGSVAYTCSLVLAANSQGFPFEVQGYTQELNDADTLDFETNYKPTANASIELRSSDGRAVIRNTTASRTHSFNLKVFSFVPGQASSAVNKDVDFTDLQDLKLTCYNSSGAVTTDPAAAVKTVVDWEPTYNYEIIGGWVDIPTSILAASQCTWYVSALGVPDVPKAYGGNVAFVYPTDLALVTSSKVVSDGRATQFLTYNPVYHTNKMRWIFIHPVSATHPRFQMYIEIFV